MIWVENEKECKVSRAIVWGCWGLQVLLLGILAYFHDWPGVIGATLAALIASTRSHNHIAIELYLRMKLKQIQDEYERG